MSEFETKDGSGALFKNERKERENQPDYTGNARVNGQMVDLSAWLKVSKGGKKYLSLAFKPPYVKPAQGGTPARGNAPKGDGFEDSDIPFITNGGEF